MTSNIFCKETCVCETSNGQKDIHQILQSNVSYLTKFAEISKTANVVQANIQRTRIGRSNFITRFKICHIHDVL